MQGSAKPARSERRLRCVLCHSDCSVGPLFRGCPACRAQGRAGPLDLHIETGEAPPAAFRAALADGPRHNLWRYADLLPEVATPLSLDEGGTPLTLLDELSRELGLRLYVKNETVNPTWSFKDRYAAVAVSVARQLGFTKVVCSSTATSARRWRRMPRWAGSVASCSARPLPLS